MVDYDNAEILDFETVFPNMLVYLCDFHIVPVSVKNIVA